MTVYETYSFKKEKGNERRKITAPQKEPKWNAHQ